MKQLIILLLKKIEFCIVLEMLRPDHVIHLDNSYIHHESCPKYQAKQCVSL